MIFCASLNEYFVPLKIIENRHFRTFYSKITRALAKKLIKVNFICMNTNIKSYEKLYQSFSKFCEKLFGHAYPLNVAFDIKNTDKSL